jgi:RNA-binding protein YhbY
MSDTTTSTGRPPSCAASAWATASSRKSPCDEDHALDGLHRQHVQRDDAAVQRAHGRAAGRKAAAQVLAPGAGRRAQVHHHLARPQQTQGFVDLLELVGGARAIAVALRQLDVGVVDVVVEPGLVDLLALGLTSWATDNRHMTAIQLTPAERKEHRSSAHHLDPVVMIGGDGLTPAVRKEVDQALKAHGLIKVRVFSDDRAAREAMLADAGRHAGRRAHPAHRQAAGAVAAHSAQGEGRRATTACPARAPSRW